MLVEGLETYAVTAYWLVGLASLAALEVMERLKTTKPIAANLSAWGKTRTSSATLSVPKRWFWHFYAFGIVSWALVEVVQTIGWLHVSSSTLSTTELPYVLLLVQMARRLLECLLISSFSDATMSIVHYIVGMTFYPAAIVTFLPSSALTVPTVLDAVRQQPLLVTAFVVLSLLQFHSHLVLARLRKTGGPNASSPTPKYSLPTAGMFSLVTGPHYLTEISIYAVLVLMSRQIALNHCLLVVFVAWNLSVAATKTHAWYRSKFDLLPQVKRLIPFLW